MSVSASARAEVAAAIALDKPNFFSLADKVLAAAPERQWDFWVVDYRRAHFVRRFLEHAYVMSGAGDPPKVVDIANSRKVRGSYLHQWDVERTLEAPALGMRGSSALIISDYTKDRGGLETLATPLRKAHARIVDAAVLSLDCPSRNRTASASHVDEIYAGEPRRYEPGTYSSLVLLVAIGRECVLGRAAPEVVRDADVELGRYATGVFVDLAQEYVEGRVGA